MPPEKVPELSYTTASVFEVLKSESAEEPEVPLKAERVKSNP